ncbi:diuretic hormone receptor-like [Dermacentor albipictus]|uniref:diuretic hormone receptor-like n=1 Tax=Dermacentor albipictus TaxID=60249 RepID=UPI0038FC5151
MEGGSGNAGGASWTESEHSAALDSLVAAIENFTIEHHGSGQPDAPFDESYLANLSLAQIRCYIAALNESQAYLLDDNGGPLSCHRTWDGLSCWPVTNAGAVAVLPCFSFLNDLFYDTSNNATRTCLENGTWADRSDYSGCKPLVDVEREVDETTLYYIGYGVSLFALTIALWIFLYYKDLRCLRNTIHVNLMVTYFLVSIVWMTTATLQSIQSPVYRTGACFLYIVLTYLMGTNFFWMFVEGLYLYILVVKTFSVELVRIHVYAFVGWGLPAIVVTVWAITKAYFSANRNDPALFDSLCVWQLKDIYDCVFICPVAIVLLVNMFFMGEIMWVLITKLRATTTIETQQYRKAAKALLVLTPLLGVTYLLVIWTPSHKTAKIVFTYLQITLLSTQGFTVAVLYCFFNGEEDTISSPTLDNLINISMPEIIISEAGVRVRGKSLSREIRERDLGLVDLTTVPSDCIAASPPLGIVGGGGLFRPKISQGEGDEGRYPSSRVHVTTIQSSQVPRAYKLVP